MIELEKFSKDAHIVQVYRKKQKESFGSKLVTAVTALLLGTIVLVSLQLCFTSTDPIQFNQKLFE